MKLIQLPVLLLLIGITLFVFTAIVGAASEIGYVLLIPFTFIALPAFVILTIVAVVKSFKSKDKLWSTINTVLLIGIISFVIWFVTILIDWVNSPGH